MEEYIKWLENKIEVCLDDKDLQREHWAFCQALKKYRELALPQPPVMCEFHCERFDFGRDKKCEQQCSDCHWMQIKSQ